MTGSGAASRAGGAAVTVTVTVCVFAWNEEVTVADVVHELFGVLEGMALGSSFEILVIDDGSSDGTGATVDRLAEEIPQVRVIHHPKNEGLGPVYRTGFTEARGDCVTFFPADGQFPATIVSEFLPRMADLDLCLGYLPGRTDVVGKALSGIERVLYRALLGPMPRFQGIFMIRRSVLAEIPLASRGRGWAIVMELVLRASRRGYRIKSFPTAFRPRTAGVSKVNNWRSIKANFKQLVALRALVDPQG